MSAYRDDHFALVERADVLHKEFIAVTRQRIDLEFNDPSTLAAYRKQRRAKQRAVLIEKLTLIGLGAAVGSLVTVIAGLLVVWL